ncbi:N-6 DNA methylase [Sphingomonas sp.]|uniref:N-6 DNA methylase n=1 Tax=Sphingomonas sp. TaxID=28214 RepID=UPI00307FA6B9
MSPQDRHIRNVLKLFNAHGHRHDRYTLFSDCMELIAISISNSVDSRSRLEREARYLEIVGRYDRPAVEMFPQVFGEITMALEAGPGDVLGSIFTALEIHNKNRGQFFTPYPVCQMMAGVMLGSAEDARALIEAKGFVSAMEPACGAGAMVIALAEAMLAAEINYQRYLHVTAIDIDSRAVHMAYIQFALLHIPGHVIVGNSLSLETREHWFTPAHILGGWNGKLASRPRASERPRRAELGMPPGRSSPRTTAAEPTVSTIGAQLTLF